MIGRRALLGVVAASATVPRLAWAQIQDEAAAAKDALDAAAKAGSAEERVRLLRPIRTRAMPVPLRIDIEAVIAGASVEAEIARDFPFTGDLGTPFAVSLSDGAWRSIGKPSSVRGDALVKRLDAETGQVRLATDRGVVLPRAVLSALLGKLDGASAQAGDPSVASALERQREALAAAGRSTTGEGLRKANDGERLYALLLRLQAGEEVDPAMLHQRMAELCERLTERADMLLRGQGLTQGSVAERLRAFARDPRFLYADSDAGRDRAVADMNGWLDAARLGLPRQFGTVPQAAQVVRARRMSAADESAGRSGYRIVPDAANGFDGGYFVDLSHIRQRPSWSLRSVVHHELLPGHMMQLPLQADAHPHPLRLRYAPGFVEGWGIYGEQLADETGAFATDPAGAIGYVQWMLFRAARSLIDTGINLMGWTSDEAARRLADMQGDPAIFAPFAKDAIRAVTEPAGFAGQAWNWQCFKRLGAAAGPPGSAGRRDMHDAMLCHGAMPLATLRTALVPGKSKG